MMNLIELHYRIMSGIRFALNEFLFYAIDYSRMDTCSSKKL